MNPIPASDSSAEFHPSRDINPSHVGIIPDGARRWARREGCSLLQSYERSMATLAQFVGFFYEEGVSAVSLYLSSLQNFRRTPEEVDAMCAAEELLCRQHLGALAISFDTKVRAVGRRDVIPRHFLRSVERLEESTVGHGRTRLYLCIAYSPVDEVVAACRAALDVRAIARNLEVPEPVDIVIRTGGANLLSNFLPLQCGFARLYFLDKLFNDIERSDLRSVLEKFRALQRKYGE